MSVKKAGPSKIYSYQLLRKCETWRRLDVFPIFFTTTLMWSQFGSKIFDREELVPVLSFMLWATFHSLMFFVNFWSADINVYFSFSTLKDSQVGQCSHVWVKVENLKQGTTKKLVVPIESVSLEVTPGNLQTVYSIEIMKKRMLWSNDRKTFQAIPYPTKEPIEFYQTAEGLKDRDEEKRALLVWGNNKMNIPIPNFLDLY